MKIDSLPYGFPYTVNVASGPVVQYDGKIVFIDYYLHDDAQWLVTREMRWNAT